MGTFPAGTLFFLLQIKKYKRVSPSGTSPIDFKKEIEYSNG